MPIKKFTNEDEKYACDNYLLKSSTLIAKEIGCSRSWVLKTWINNNLSGKEIGRQYYLNENYFKENINEKKAYILGFIAADGCLYERENHQSLLSIVLSEKDKEILEYLKKEILFENPIKIYKKNNLKYCSIQITSNILIESIKDYFIYPNKTWNINFYDIFNKLTKKYFMNFIQGYFDGDGTINSQNINSPSSYNIGISLPEKSGLQLMKILKNEYSLNSSFIKDNRKYKESFGFISFKNSTEKYVFCKYMNLNNIGLIRKKEKITYFNKIIETNLTNRLENKQAIFYWQNINNGSL